MLTKNTLYIHSFTCFSAACYCLFFCTFFEFTVLYVIGCENSSCHRFGVTSSSRVIMKMRFTIYLRDHQRKTWADCEPELSCNVALLNPIVQLILCGLFCTSLKTQFRYFEWKFTLVNIKTSRKEYFEARRAFVYVSYRVSS